MSNKWQPASAADIDAIVEHALLRCAPEQRALFATHRVPFFQVPIRGYGKVERVYVVARFGERVLYFEDVEEGFAISSLDETGAIPERDCNQFDLGHALYELLISSDGELDAIPPKPPVE